MKDGERKRREKDQEKEVKVEVEHEEEKEEEESRNSTYEDNDVSEIHTTRWRRAWSPEWMMDPASAAPEEGVVSGEQPEERLKRPGTETESEGLSIKPKRQRENRERRNGERQTRQRSENTQHIVLRLPTAAAAAATAAAAAAHTAPNFFDSAKSEYHNDGHFH